MTEAPDDEIYAIRFASDERRRRSENFMPPLTEPADEHELPMPSRSARSPWWSTSRRC